MADTAAPAQARFCGIDVPARLQQALALLFPSNLAAKAVLFAVVLALLPTGEAAPRIWELPHILLLGLVISYGVFGQRNADDADADIPAAKIVEDEDDHEDESLESYVSQLMQGPLVFEPNGGDGESSSNGAAAKDGVDQAWSSQYYPDDPLVVVADKRDGTDKPLLLPVRKLKPAAAEEPSATGGNLSDDGIDDETEFLVPKEEGYLRARERAMPSPSSVLDAGMTLSPSSPPPPPPPAKFIAGGRGGLGKAKARSFNEYGAGDLSMSWRAGSRSGNGGGGGDKYRFRSNSASQATRRSAFAGYDYDPVAPFEDQVPADDDELDEVAAASDSSFGSDGMATDGDDGLDKEEDNYEEEEVEASSCDEELFDLATRPGPEEEEDEVDRKADEFIAKFREQIRMQRAEQGRS